MKPIKSFSQLGIETEGQLSGKKIGISHVLNREITIKGYRIDPSKFPDEGNGKRLTLQIVVDDTEHVIFTSSIILQDQVKQVTESDFPFTATIVPITPRGFKLT